MPIKQRILDVIFALLTFLLVSVNSYADIYYPHVASGGGWETEICAINTDTTSTVAGTLKGYSNAGTVVSTTPLTLLPKSRRQIIVGQELVNPSQIGYMVFESSASSAVGYTKFYTAGLYCSAIPAVSSTNSGDIFITHIASDATWWTGISLVNTTAAPKALTIEFDNHTTRTLTLAAKEHSAFTIRSLFGEVPQSSIHSAVVRNSTGVIGLELFGSSATLDGVPLTNKTATDLYYPHIESSNPWWTGIVAYNPGTVTVNLTINSYALGGSFLGSRTAQVPAGGKYIGVASTLGLPLNTAWLHVHADGPLSGFELFGNETQLAGYSVMDIATKNGVFAKIQPNGWTGIAFVNIEAMPAAVTLTALNDSGAVVATQNITLGTHEKRVGLVEGLFGASIVGATNVRFTSDRNIAGFQLNSDNSNTMLDALPALFPSGSEIQEGLDAILRLLRFQSDLDDGQDELSNVISQVLNGGGGTCPTVTVTPPLDNLETLPPSITLTATYTNGCISESGATMSGDIVLNITNLVYTDTNISLDYVLTANNLTADGQLLLNGSVSGHIAITISGEDLSGISFSANFNNMQLADATISGGLLITGTNVELGDTVSFGQITVSFNNLTVKDYTVNSGAVVITSPSATQTQMAADLMTSLGAARITFLIEQPTDTRTVFSTAQPGTIGEYTVSLNQVTLDTAVCMDYPISGTITLVKGGSTSTVTFTGACDGTYILE